MTRIAVFQMSAAIDAADRPARIVSAMKEAAGAGARRRIGTHPCAQMSRNIASKREAQLSYSCAAPAK